MADPYSDLDNAEEAMQRAVADAMDARCVDPAQIRMRQDYMGRLTLPEGAFAVELGSGTGHVTHDLLSVAGVSRALGLEPARLLVERARSHYPDHPALTFDIGDAKATGLEAGSVDLVLMHTLLCHVPGPEEAVAEAFRILKPGGQLVIFDGDYDTTSVAIADFDPLAPVVRYMIDANVHNQWLSRQLGPLTSAAGFVPGEIGAHGYLASGDCAYFRTVVERGLVKMQEDGLLTAAGAEGPRAETEARIAEGRFHGYMSYTSSFATKPG
jgi:arsenite methyltransferase